MGAISEDRGAVQAMPSSRPDNISNYNRPGSIAAMITATNPGSFTMIVTPLLLTAFLQSGDLTPAQATSLGAGELAGMTAASFASALVVARIDRRLLVGSGLVLAIAGHLLSISFHDYLPILFSRFLAGFGVGTMFTVAVASLAGLNSPDRAFGFSMTTNQIATLMLMGVLAKIGTEGGPVQIVMTVAIASALMGIAIPFIPAWAPAAEDGLSVPGGARSTTLLPAMLALCGILAFNVGIGAVWPLIGQLGISRGVPSTIADATIALAGFAAIAGGMAAAVLGTRFGRLPVLTLCMLCLAVAMLLLRGSFSVTEYRVLVLAFMFFWPLSIPFLLGTLAAHDPSGRLAALSGAMLPCGMALGQGLAAATVSNGDFAKVIWIGLPAILAALGFIAAGTLGRSRKPLSAS